MENALSLLEVHPPRDLSASPDLLAAGKQMGVA